MSFGTNIGYLRKKKGMTQEEFAERMYVSRQTVSRWETDSVYPDVETVIKLCEVLECDMETLVRGDASIEKTLDELAPSLETDPAKNSKKVSIFQNILNNMRLFVPVQRWMVAYLYRMVTIQ